MVIKTDKYFWIANAVIILSLVIFFSRSLFTDKIPAPADFKTYSFFVSRVPSTDKPVQLLYDPIVQYFPWFHFDKQVFKSGKLPLWNPYQGCGTPHIANMQSSIFYPLNMFVFLLSWKWGLFFLYFFKLYFIGLFLYLYLREIKISPQVSIIFSVASMYTSFNTILLYFPTTTSAFLFPLSLWAIERILNPVREPHPRISRSDSDIKPLQLTAFSNGVKDQSQFRPYLIFCLGLVFALFGGNPEVVFYSMFTATIYFVIRLHQSYGFRAYKEYLSLLGKLCAVLLIGVLIAAIQLLPFLQYLQLSSAYLARNVLDLPLNNLPAYLMLFNILPVVPGSKLALSSIFEQYHTIIIFAYAGVSVLLLGISGIVTLTKDKTVRALTVVAALSLLTGFYIPYLHGILIKFPGFDLGRNYYMLIFFGWALIIIGSKALDAFLARELKFSHLNIAVATIAGLILVLGLWFAASTYPSLSHDMQKTVTYSLLYSIAFSALIIALTFFVLNVKNNKLLVIFFGILIYAQTALPMIFIEPAIKPEYFYPKNKILAMLRTENEKPFRVTAFITKNQPIAYATNINTFYQIEDIRNYDSLGVNWYNSIFQYMNLSDALNLTNVKYLIEGKDFDVSAFTNIFQPVTEYNGYIIYKNLSAFDRAFMVYNYSVAETDQQALDLLHTYSGQLNKVAVIFKKDVLGMPFSSNTPGTYAINFIKYTPGYIKLSCTTSQYGLFFISDTYFPGWHARVDGKETKIIRTDYAFQGLWLTQGTHTIELTYDPASFKYGTLLSILGILSLIGFYLIAFRKKKLRHKV